MEPISLRLDEGMMHELEKLMRKNHFATTTEFVRAAIRDKMKELEREELVRNIRKLAGSSKRKTTDEQRRNAGEEAFEALEKKHLARYKRL